MSGSDALRRGPLALTRWDPVSKVSGYTILPAAAKSFRLVVLGRPGPQASVAALTLVRLPLWLYKKWIYLISGVALMTGTPSSIQTATLTVDAKSDIFLAGQNSVPDFIQSANQLGPGGGILPPYISVVGGETLTLTATGTVSAVIPYYSEQNPDYLNGPDGRSGLVWQTTADISGYGL